MTDALPQQIGKYKIVELVGEGAMGTVYRAVDSVLGRTVAIKVMNAEIARQKDHRQRFLREAQAAGSLQHPNVVTIYDLGELDGHLFIAMEYVHGTDLERLMASADKPLKIQEKLDIIVDVLMGLSYAHKHGIIHRDIKPANIRVGDDGHAKIMDFGVAHLQSSDMTKTGLVVGTPSYMAPEQVMGGKSVPGTDLFAVGAVLYHLLTGTKPFEGPTLQSLFYRIVTDMPKPLDQVRPGLPVGLNTIIQKAMAKEPADRYPTALDMANAIIAVRADLSGNAFAATASLSMSGENAAVIPPPEVPSLVSSSNKIPWKPIAAAAGILVVLLGAWMMSGRKSGETRVAANDAAADSATAAPAVTQSSVGAATTATVPAPSAQPKDTQPPPAPPAQETKKESAKASPPEKKRETAARTRDEQKKTQKPAPKPVTPTRTTTTAQTQTRTQPAVQTPSVTAQVVSPQVQEPPPRIVIAPPPPPPPPAIRQPDPEPRPAPREEISSAVQAYARAIESRDIGAVRRAYPGITSDQARGFEQFFQSARSINVTFRVTDVDTNGSNADARLVGTYQYTTSDGISQSQPVSFSASLRYDGSSWRLTSVR
jgi:serine/threonine-protein kinase